MHGPVNIKFANFVWTVLLWWNAQGLWLCRYELTCTTREQLNLCCRTLQKQTNNLYRYETFLC